MSHVYASFRYLCIILAFCFSGILSTLTAQTTTGTVTGLLTDSSGAAVMGVPVKLTSTRTSVTQTTTSNESGVYVFSFVAPGPYQIEVEMDGFQKVLRSFTLEVAQQARLDIQLAVGQVSESVEVQATAVILDADSSSLGQVVNNRQVMELPLNGRNPFALASLSPGVTPLGGFGSGLATSRAASQAAGANNFQANGGMTGSNEILLDGIPITVCCQGQPALIPTIDTTEEFKVQTNTSPAEYGRTSGGILNIVSKTGGNQLRGSLYEFFRNEKLDAANFFVNRAATAPMPGREDRRTPLRYNQFGGTLGGPVFIPKYYDGRDRTFFFVNYEGTKVRRSQFATFSVPTTQMRSGDFTEAGMPIYDPLTTAADPANPGSYTRTPFANNLIPTSRLSNVARNILNLYPTPQRSGIVNNLDSVASSSDDDRQYSVRLDHNFSDRSRLFGRYSNLTNDHYEPNFWNSVSSPGGYNQFIRSHVFVLDQINTLSPTMVLNFRYGFARQRNFRDPYSLGTDLRSLGFSDLYASQVQENYLPTISINGFSGNNEGSNQRFTRYSHNVAAALSWVHNAHTVKFGYDGRVFLDHNSTLSNPAGGYSFGTNFTNGPNPFGSIAAGQAPYLAFASFLLGTPTGGSINYSDATSQQGFYHALYLQDDWKVTSKLTVNLGLRWEMETGPTESYNRIATLDPDITSPLASLTGLPLTGGLVFRGVNGASRGRYKTDANNFGPRIGFAYSVDPKTIIRGGFGVFFSPGLVRLYNGGNPGFSVSTPFVSTIDSVNPVGNLANPYPTGLMPLAGSSLGASTLVGGGLTALNYDTPLPYASQWNFGIQRELPGAMAVNLTYAGNQGTKLPIGVDLNALNPMYYGAIGDSSQVAYLNQSVPNPFYGIITNGTLAASTVQRNQLLRAHPQFTGFYATHLGIGNSTYHALQASLQKRLTHGLMTTISYTFSKNIGDVNMLTTSFFDAGQNPGYQNVFDRSLDRSVLGSDFPHRLSTSVMYELPFGRGRSFGSSMPRWVDAVVGGWQTSSLFTYQSGQALNFGVTGGAAYSGSRASYTGVGDVQTSGSITDRLGGVSGGGGYLNAAAFRVPYSFEFGNTPRLDSQNRGPATVNLDLSLIKNFQFTERMRLQFRAEAFNLTNTPIFGLPNTTVGSAGFGVIGSQANQPRNLQMGLKLFF